MTDFEIIGDHLIFHVKLTTAMVKIKLDKLVRVWHENEVFINFKSLKNDV